MDKLRAEKKSVLYIILCSIFLANALIADIIGSKIFAVDKLLSATPMELGFQLSLSVGILIWPIVFLTSDIINEYFGRVGVRRISYLTAIMIAYSSVMILAGTKLPPADFWLANNSTDATGRLFDINFAYSKLLSQSIGIIVGSITAFLVSQLVDVYTFHWIRRFTGHKMLWLRATGSTVVSQLIDSFVILFIAFYLLGNWSFKEVIAVGVWQYTYKVSMAIILTPLIYVAHSLIDKYLGVKHEKSQTKSHATTEDNVKEEIED